jgi:hypothetical protein
VQDITIALKRGIKMKTVQKLILDSDSNVHTCEDDISSPQSDIDTEEDNRTETGCTEWTDTTQS